MELPERCEERLAARFALALVAAVVVYCIAWPALAFADEPVASGWNDEHTSYFVSGKAVVGAKQIGGKWYAFNEKGVLMKSKFTTGGVSYYPDSEGVLRAREAKELWYYADGRRMTETSTLDFQCLLRAEEIVGEIIDEGDSQDEALLKCFNYLMRENGKKFKYPMREWGGYGQDGWTAIYARDMLDGNEGDCISSACAFAYLAAAAGVKDVKLCTNTMSKEPHGYVMINNRFFDPQVANKYTDERRWNYYNVEDGSWRNNDETYRNLLKREIPIPLYCSNYEMVKNGLKKENGSYYFYDKGVKARSVWKGVNGKRYWFSKDGKAAVKPCKIDGTYYIFNTVGQLQTGSKTRVVKIAGVKYRVTKSGKAEPGKAKGGVLYLSDGSQAKGACKVGGRWRVYSAKGVLMRSKKATRVVKVAGTYYRVKKDGSAFPGWDKKRVRYYRGTGERASGLCKVDGLRYYVFAKNGKLLRGKKTRVVKVGGALYQVTKGGKAKLGWSKGHKYLFVGNGEQAKGACVYKGQYYYLDSEGAYDAGKTAKLRILAKKGASGSALVALLGKPLKTYRGESCMEYKGEMGDDGLYTYEHLLIQTYIITQEGAPDKGAEYVINVSEL